MLDDGKYRIGHINTILEKNFLDTITKDIIYTDEQSTEDSVPEYSGVEKLNDIDKYPIVNINPAIQEIINTYTPANKKCGYLSDKNFGRSKI